MAMEEKVVNRLVYRRREVFYNSSLIGLTHKHKVARFLNLGTMLREQPLQARWHLLYKCRYAPVITLVNKQHDEPIQANNVGDTNADILLSVQNETKQDYFLW